MKKRKIMKVVCFIIIMGLMLAMAACGDGSGESVEYLVMGTGGVSGTWYPVGGVICAAISKDPGISATAQSSAAGVENIRLVASGERQLGFAMPSLAVYAEEGIEAFEGTPIDSIRAIAVMMPMSAHFVVRADAGIDSIEDLRGKSIGVGAPGSGDEVCAREILSAVGLTYDDVNEKMLSYSEQTTAFKDRQLDAMFMLASVPTSAIMDAASQADVKIISMDQETVDSIIAQYPYYAESVITSDQYAFMTEDALTIGIPTMMFTSADLDEDTIYRAVKAMFEDIETIQASHASMTDFSLENALEGLTVELHPGAEKYYKEAGLL